MNINNEKLIDILVDIIANYCYTMKSIATYMMR